jgi:hypothetical protein
VPDNRQSVRHDVKLSARVVINDETLDAEVQNLSLGGALISHDGDVPMGERVTVTFSIPTREKPITIGSAVRWSTGTALGVQFDGLRAAEVWSLNKYFENL